MELIPLKDCVKGRVYKLRSRNLRFGVYNGSGGFIGIREKFGTRFLEVEDHWDAPGERGTVKGAVDTTLDLPEDVEPTHRLLGSVDRFTGRDVDYIEVGGNFVWAYAGSTQGDPTIQAVDKANMPLKEYLEMIEEQAQNV